MKKAASWAILLAALLPLIMSPNLVTYAVGGKTVFIRGLAFLAIAVITIALYWDKQKEIRMELLERIKQVVKNPLFIAIATTIFFLVLSTIFAYDKSTAFFGEIFRAEGFLTIFSFFVLFFSMAVLFGKKEWDRYFLITTIVSLVLIIIAFRQGILGMQRPESLVGNPIFLATYLIFSVTSAGYVYLEGRKTKNNFYKYLGIATAILSIVGIFLTKTRGTIFALGVALFVTFIIAAVQGKGRMVGKKSLRFWASIALALTILFSGVFLLTKKASFWQHIPGLNRLAETSLSEGTAASRIKFTQISLNGFFHESDTKTFLLGWGWDNFTYFFQGHYDPLVYYYDQGITDRAHNKLIDVLVMSGLVGLIMYLIAWFYLFRYAVVLMRKRFSVGLLTLFFLTSYFVNNLFVFDVAVTYLAFYSIAAYLLYNSYERK